MDVAGLLEPIDDDAPSGENLEYEMIFTEMELASQYGEERQMGDSVMVAEDPDFGDLASKAMAVVEKSHDLRAAVFLAEAAVHTDGLPAFAEAVELVHGYLERYWETCHPQLDEDDGDPTMRVNAVQGLADGHRMLRSLRRAALTDSRAFGRIALRDIEVAEGRAEPAPGSEVRDTAAVNAAFKDTPPETLEAFAAAIEEARTRIKAIDGIFSDQAPGQGPQLDKLSEMLRTMAGAIAKYGEIGTASGADAADGGEPAVEALGDAGPGPTGGAPAAVGGPIRSPDDVVRTLDEVIDYYHKREPSSPVPILLGRAKRLVNADFVTIIKDMAGEGMEEVRRVGGLPQEEEEW